MQSRCLREAQTQAKEGLVLPARISSFRAFAHQHPFGFLQLTDHPPDERGFPDADRPGQRNKVAQVHMLFEATLNADQFLGFIEADLTEVFGQLEMFQDIGEHLILLLRVGRRVLSPGRRLLSGSAFTQN